MKHALLVMSLSAVLVLGGCVRPTQTSLAAGETAPSDRALSVTFELDTGKVRLLDPVALQRDEADAKR